MCDVGYYVMVFTEEVPLPASVYSFNFIIAQNS